MVWQCFHCDEVCETKEAAALHFGTSEYQRPACLIPIEEYRAMEGRMNAYNDEDAAIHRQIRDVEYSKAQAVKDAEQRGYDKGIRDADKERVQELRALASEMDLTGATATGEAWTGWTDAATLTRKRAEQRTMDGGWRTLPATPNKSPMDQMAEKGAAS